MPRKKKIKEESPEKTEMAQPAPSKSKVKPQIRIHWMTFDRYFISLGKPMHHKQGMVAYTNTRGKKTKEAWTKIFKDY